MESPACMVLCWQLQSMDWRRLHHIWPLSLAQISGNCNSSDCTLPILQSPISKISWGFMYDVFMLNSILWWIIMNARLICCIYIWYLCIGCDLSWGTLNIPSISEMSHPSVIHYDTPFEFQQLLLSCHDQPMYGSPSLTRCHCLNDILLCIANEPPTITFTHYYPMTFGTSVYI